MTRTSIALLLPVLMASPLRSEIVRDPELITLADIGATSDEKIETRGGGERSDRWITGVTRPTLEVYFPAPSDATGAAVVICPGGGYGGLSYDKEGTFPAQWFAERGLVAGVLKYRVGGGDNRHPAPLSDVQSAIRAMRDHADEWGVDPAKVGVMGHSAGGHLAASASTQLGKDDPATRPNFSILVYPVISMRRGATHGGSRANLIGAESTEAEELATSNERFVTERTPPTFIIHSMDDGAVPVANPLAYLAACQEAGAPVELHLFEKGGHGYGMWSESGSLAHWPTLLEAWLKSRGLAGTPDNLVDR